jgi:hypothetical protein
LIFISTSCVILIAQWREVSYIAGATKKAVIQDAKEDVLMEFEEVLRRSIKQVDEGLVKTFKTKEEFSDHIRDLE